MTTRGRISYAIRIVVSHGLYYSGLLHLLRRVVLRRKAVVLMYHRVLTREQRARTASHPAMIVEDETFARQIAFLKQHFKVLTLAEFADHLARREPFDGPCCLITFDDGWIDNFENALPVLRGQAVPAVLFLPVNFIGDRRLFTREAVTHLLVSAVRACRADPARSGAMRAHLEPLGFASLLDLEDENPLPAVLEAVGSHRYVSGARFEALVRALSDELGVTDVELSDVDSFVDWEQIDSMRRGGFAFGGHGADHRLLTLVSPDVVRCEVRTSKKVLDERVPQPVQPFAYPNGAYDATVAETVKAEGYRLAFTVEPGAVGCDDDSFALKRVNIHEDMTSSTPMLLARLTGVF